MSRTYAALAVLAIAAIAAPAAASARTFRVCSPHQRPHGCVRSIQAAVDRAHPGDVVKVPPGVYRQSVAIKGHRHDRITLLGSPRRPRATVLELKGLPRARRQNAVLITGANRVTVSGFYARHYLGNGFFATHVRGYAFSHLVAGWGGAYGLFGYHAIGGSMSDSEAFYNNDSGFYVGETPPQRHPVRTIVTGVRAWGNVLGFSGTNMRYVTITKSLWFDNGLGIVPSALDSEEFPPPSGNAIVDNDVFWNNFDYYRAAPFPLAPGAKGLSYPVGTGILLYGSQRTRVEGNRVFGHFLVGIGAIDAIELKEHDLAAIRGITVRGNAMGRDGTDPNAYDLFYPGPVVAPNTGNCFAENTGVHTTIPADGSTLLPCPNAGPNPASPAALQTGLSFIADPTHEAHWVVHDHPPFEGITPLVHYTGPSAGSSSAVRRASVSVADFRFQPRRLTVRRGARIAWRWEDANRAPHDVKLVAAPRGVRRFTSPTATTSFTFSRRLPVRGTYRFVCTYHVAAMRLRIVVR